MKIKEQRKKIQRSIVYLVDTAPSPEMVERELNAIDHLVYKLFNKLYTQINGESDAEN